MLVFHPRLLKALVGILLRPLTDLVRLIGHGVMSTYTLLLLSRNVVLS